jgi:L-threonylcarbamoyladenylate synthase
MQTVRLSANDKDAVARAAEVIRAGGLVAFPTETVYGLGANALDEVAVKKIFAAKERPAWDPMIVHVASREMLHSVVTELPKSFAGLWAAFMPGPLTLVLKKTSAVPGVVTAGRNTVAVRFPAHPVARALIAAAGVPIAAPSANRFSRVSPTMAEHVLADLDGRIDAVLDGGACAVGVESTVLDLTSAPPCVLRQGGVTVEQLRSVLGVVAIGGAKDVAGSGGLPSPGMTARHYAPRTKLVLTGPTEKDLADAVREKSDRKVGAMMPTRWNAVVAAKFDWGVWGDWTVMASRLYAGLRWLDEQQLDVIVAPLPPEEGLGAAIAERLRKAAAKG